MQIVKKKYKDDEVEKKTYLFPDAIIYGEYKTSVIERVLSFLVGFIIGYMTGYVFYEVMIISIIAGIITGAFFVTQYRKKKIKKQKEEIKYQFKSLLESLSFSLSAGKTVIDAFVGAKEDLKMQYSQKDYIVKEIENIILGLNHNFTIEDLLFDMAERSESEDIRNFANVFATCYGKGGEIKEVIMSTYHLINDKMEISMEIETMVAASKTEQNMMLIMPVIFTFILNFMGADMTGKGTAIGYITTTIALLCFAVAYIVGKKILNIKL